jgi:hypothetical protein
MQYLNDCVFSSTELCASCLKGLGITDEYQFVVRTHDNRMWHGKCIVAIIKQLCGDSSQDTLTKDEKKE